MNKDSAILVDGSRFDFWEKEVRYVKELFVDGGSASAADDNDGSREHPFKTIQAAARVATAGTHVWIMPGEYRECVSPMHGGDGPESMVCYEAVEKGTVVIKASERVTEFEPTTEWMISGFGAPVPESASVWCHRLNPEM
ncbi:MAG: DUF1565 domain-containing protein, partial [Lachnospiraceae bacterium]|nr:DUF1565 domain-containing protein [Lachnospiraceae bacterium]